MCVMGSCWFVEYCAPASAIKIASKASKIPTNLFISLLGAHGICLHNHPSLSVVMPCFKAKVREGHPRPPPLAFTCTGDYTVICLSRSKALVGESPLFCWPETNAQFAAYSGPSRGVRGRRKVGTGAG